jgi:CHAD domain-containing protein
MAKPDVSLHPDETIASGVMRIADQEIGRAIRRIEHPTRERAADVHEVRTSIKKIRAMLRLVRPVIPERAFTRENAALRSAARHLSGARDAAVARRTITRCAKTTGRKPAVQSTLLDLLLPEESHESPDVVERAMAIVAGELKVIRARLGRLHLCESEWEAIEPGLRKVMRQCRRRMRVAIESDEDEDFHRWRIRVKNLYHELQLVESIWPKRLGKMLACLRKLQRRIGDLHDVAVAKALLAANAATPATREKIDPIVERLDARAARLKRDSRKLGHQLFDKKPGTLLKKLRRRWRKWSDHVSAPA